MAEQFGVPFHDIGDEEGNPTTKTGRRSSMNTNVDYIVLARYMRVLPPSTCWQFAGGRIVNLHHGLLPSFPGFRPYQDAYQPPHADLWGDDATSSCRSWMPGTRLFIRARSRCSPARRLEAIIRHGETDHEPACLVEGLAPRGRPRSGTALPPRHPHPLMGKNFKRISTKHLARHCRNQKAYICPFSPGEKVAEGRMRGTMPEKTYRLNHSSPSP